MTHCNASNSGTKIPVNSGYSKNLTYVVNGWGQRRKLASSVRDREQETGRFRDACRARRWTRSAQSRTECFERDQPKAQRRHLHNIYRCISIYIFSLFLYTHTHTHTHTHTEYTHTHTYTHTDAYMYTHTHTHTHTHTNTYRHIYIHTYFQ
jgi:hypothetical protein